MIVGFVYLAALLAALGSMLRLDWRFRLFFFRAPLAAGVVTVVGTAFFLLWDAGGIALGIFLQGQSDFATGLVLAPELPVEEPIFLVFLVVCTMVLYTGAAKLLNHWRKHRRSPSLTHQEGQR